MEVGEGGATGAGLTAREYVVALEETLSQGPGQGINECGLIQCRRNVLQCESDEAVP